MVRLVSGPGASQDPSAHRNLREAGWGSSWLLEGGPRPSESPPVTRLPVELGGNCYHLSASPWNSRCSQGLVHSSSSCCVFTLHGDTQRGLCPRGSRLPVKGGAVGLGIGAVTAVCVSQCRHSEKSPSPRHSPQPRVIPCPGLLCALPARRACPLNSLGALGMNTDMPTSAPRPGLCAQHTRKR